MSHFRNEIGLTAEVDEWAVRAGYSITELSTDGRAVVWSPGGEIRYFVGIGPDGWIVVTSSERMGEEQFELASLLPGLVERRFIFIFARLVRVRSGLPRLSRRYTLDSLATGYSVGVQPFRGEDHRILTDPQGRVIAVVGGGELVGTVKAVELSVLADSATEAIVQSIMDPVGEPLFSVQ